VKWAEHFGKNLLRGTCQWLFSSTPRDPSELVPTDVKQILVVRQDNRIGNLILQIPFLKALHKTFPNAEITVLLGSTYAELYAYLPEVQHQIIYRHIHLARHPWQWLPFIQNLSKGNWDLAFECGHPHVVSLNNASLTYFSKAPFRIGFQRGDANIFLNVPLKAPNRCHYATTLKSLLVPWIETQESFPMTLALPEKHQDAYRRLWENAGLDEKSKVVLIWSGGRYDKRWQFDILTSMASLITQEFDALWTPVIGIGPGEYNIELTSSQIKDYKVIKFDGPIEELWSFINQCQAMISGDTGPMHLAVAMGIPTLALFRVDNVWEYGHDNGKYHRAIAIKKEEFSSTVLDYLKTLPEDTCPKSTIYY
jgi:ADP-heptose:LPS heptosyltransferase